MRHDIRLGHVVGEFAIAPEIAQTAGSAKLVAKADDGTIQAEEMVIKANDTGIFKYFCSVRGHAKGGMWGHMAIGVPPGNLKQPPKTEHVHSPDEDHAMPAKPGEKKPDVKPTPTPHDHGTQPPKQPGETKPHDMSGMDHGPGAMKRMSSTVNLGDAMEREASGTAWNPDSSPVYAKMKMFDNGGMLMLMGTAFVRYTRRPQPRRRAVDVHGDVFAPHRREGSDRISRNAES